MIEIQASDPASPGARALLAQSHALMRELFAEEDNHFLGIAELQRDNIHFFTASAGAQTLGTGALAERGDYGEIKSMFTAPSARGKGVAGALLAHLEAKARQSGLTCLRLETGDSLIAAQNLYRRHGFSECGPFGDYSASPRSVFFEKRLA